MICNIIYMSLDQFDVSLITKQVLISLNNFCMVVYVLMWFNNSS